MCYINKLLKNQIVIWWILTFSMITKLKGFVMRIEKCLKALKRLSLNNNMLFNTYSQTHKSRRLSSRYPSLNSTLTKLPYYEYAKLRRNSKMKVISHFKEDGPTVQQVIEELLLEVVVVK